MFETEQKKIEEQVQAYLKENNLPEMNIQWAWIPFSGNWGIATSFFQLAAQDANDTAMEAQSANETAFVSIVFFIVITSMLLSRA